jgi:hypothetical protein
VALFSNVNKLRPPVNNLIYDYDETLPLVVGVAGKHDGNGESLVAVFFDEVGHHVNGNTSGVNNSELPISP